MIPPKLTDLTIIVGINSDTDVLNFFIITYPIGTVLWRRVQAHRSWVLYCQIAVDGRSIVTTSGDHNARIWWPQAPRYLASRLLNVSFALRKIGIASLYSILLSPFT